MKKLLFLLFSIGILASVYTVVQNHATEWGWRNVEICVDLDEVFLLAQSANVTPAEMLAKLRDLGVTAVGTREADVARYHRSGALTVAAGSELIHDWRLTGETNAVLLPLLENKQIRPNTTYILLEDKQLAQRLVDKAGLKLQKPVRAYFNQQPFLIEIDEELSRVLSLRIGLDPADSALLRQAGLRMVPRPDNAFLTSEAAVRETLEQFLELPAELLSVIVFDGPEVSGYPAHLATAAAVMAEAGQPLGIVEFAERPAGIYQLSSLIGHQTVLVHPNQPGRPPQSIVNSVQERRVRLVYLRLPLGEVGEVEQSLALVQSVTEALARNGYRGAPIRAVTLPGHGLPQLLLMLLGLAAAATLLFAAILRRESRLLWLVFSVTLLGLLLLFPLFSANVALQFSSVLAALLFSTLAVVSQQLNRLPVPVKNNSTALSWALVTMIRTFLLVAAGGAMVVALTSTSYFAGGTAIFRGVKLVHVLPLLVITPLAISRIFYCQITSWTLARLIRGSRNFFSRPLLLLHLAVFLSFSAVGFIYVARTGNAGIPVLALELRLRELLDVLLVVRPRLKEFFFAYPAALLGLTFLAKGSRSALTTALVAVGAIAPISMANTFMHFTAPTTFYSALFRSFNGLWLGIVIGLVLYGAFLLLAPFWEKKVQNL